MSVPGPAVNRLAAIVGVKHVLTGVALSPYVIEGRTPEAAVFPGSVDEVAAILKLAGELRFPVVPWGGGTAASVGLPPPAGGVILGLGRLERLVEHEPGDLTATVEAGLTIAELQARLRARGQWMSLDPPDAERATIGGVVAANASGPRRHLYGTVRDLLIGVTVVTADGAVVRGGGKVVKNVAGYDVPKLYVGSYGTLGVIVEVTVKLRPVPDVERLVAVRYRTLKDAAVGVKAVMASDLIPNALELLDAEAARVLGLEAHPALIVGFDGLAEQVDWQCEELGRLASASGGGEVRALPPQAWSRLGRAAAAAAFEAPASVMRCMVLPGQVSDTIEQAGSAARARGLRAAWSAHAGVGVVTGVLAAPRGAEAAATVAAVLGEWRTIARANGGWAVLEAAPLAVKESLPVWDDLGAAGRVMQRIKSELDPNAILNPGRFVAGI